MSGTHASSAVPLAPQASLSRSIKIWIGLGALATTAGTALINGIVNVHFAGVQADKAERKASVQKLEAMVDEFDQLTRTFVGGVARGNFTESAREAVSVNVQKQYSYLGTLLPLVPNEVEQAQVSAYREQLVAINATLREATDVPTTMRFARAVSAGVDNRIAALNALRGAVDLPVEVPAPDAKEPSSAFGEKMD